MSVLGKLSSVLGHRDEVPNQELAAEIAANNDAAAIEELILNLNHKEKAIQNDCIKVLYEVGGHKPSLIATYLDDFLGLLSHKNNRLQWGGMIALGLIASINPKGIYSHLSEIMIAADKGSVITRDHAVNILLQLAKHTEYEKTSVDLLFEQLSKCPVNQFPMYAERILPVMNGENKEAFRNIINLRFDEMHKASMKKRLEKVMKKLSK